MTTTQTPKVAYWIPEFNFPKLVEKLDKINRKAAKLGEFAIQFAKTGNTKVEEIVVGQEITLESAPDYVAIKRKVAFVEVEVTGKAPSLNGWSFVATLEHANELGNVLRIVPGYDKELPHHFRTATAENCDHCHTRRQRNDTYVLAHESGRYAQVGSTCLKDFLGYNDPHGAARFCELLLMAGEACQSESGSWAVGGGEYIEDLGQFLSFCIAQVRHDGFISRKKQREEEEAGRYINSTASRALTVMHPSTHDRKHIQAWETPTEEDGQEAARIADWCMALKDRNPDSLNDFMHNLKVATATGYVGGKKTGIAAAAIVAYRRENERKAEQPDLANSKHIGTVGERVQGKAKLVKVIAYDGQFGTTYIHRFLTEGGNVAVWFASKSSGMLEGNEYTIKGTVKKHDVRDGIKQTILGRVVEVQPKVKKAKEAR